MAHYNALFKLGHCQFQNWFTQQPIPSRGSTKPRRATKPSKIRDVTFTATDTPPVIEINGNNPAVVDVGTNYSDLGAAITGPQANINLQNG